MASFYTSTKSQIHEVAASLNAELVRERVYTEGGSWGPKEEALEALVQAAAHGSRKPLEAALAQAAALPPPGLPESALRPARRALERLDAEAQQQAAQVVEWAAIPGVLEHRSSYQLEEQQGLSSAMDKDAAARRQRLLARRSGEPKRWNYSGKQGSGDSIMNDRIREHDADLESRRRLAYSARGSFQTAAEDQGEEKAEQHVARERLQKDREDGLVSSEEEDNSGSVSFSSPGEREAHAARKVRIVADVDAGGLAWRATWWGVQVEEEVSALGCDWEDDPILVGDFIVSMAGHKLTELDAEVCSDVFRRELRQGVEVTIEVCCNRTARLPQTILDELSLRADLAALAADYDVELQLQKSPGPTLLLRGTAASLTCMQQSLEELLGNYFPNRA